MENQEIEYFRKAYEYVFERSRFKTQKALAEEAGVSEAALSEIKKKKKNYGHKTQTGIARALGYELLDFLDLGRKLIESEKPAKFNTSVKITDSIYEDDWDKFSHLYRKIPIYESGRLAAGTNGLIFDPYEESSSHLILPHNELGRQMHNLRGLRVGGPSMRPLIPEKSVVVVDMDDRDFYKNRVYAVNFPENGENVAAVKRVQKWKDGFALVSENPDFPPELTELDWGELCVGRVIWVWRTLETGD